MFYSHTEFLDRGKVEVSPPAVATFNPSCLPKLFGLEADPGRDVGACGVEGAIVVILY